MLRHLLICSLFVASAFTWAKQYNYNYQNYPLHFDDLYHGSRQHGNSPFGGDSIMNNQLTKSALRSLINPAHSPGVHGGLNPKGSFTKQWNQELGYNFINHEAGQENVGCRARCLKMTESPVCGSNMTRYFNSCDAECDQVTYGTDMLKYNNMCCCLKESMSLDIGKLYCVVEKQWNKLTTVPKMIVNECLMVCLERKGMKLNQDDDKVVPC